MMAYSGYPFTFVTASFLQPLQVAVNATQLIYIPPPQSNEKVNYPPPYLAPCDFSKCGSAGFLV